MLMYILYENCGFHLSFFELSAILLVLRLSLLKAETNYMGILTLNSN